MCQCYRREPVGQRAHNRQLRGVGCARRGVRVPRYIHLVAIAVTCAGLGTMTALAAVGWLPILSAVGYVLVIPAAIYLGWFWLHGLDWTRADRHEVSERNKLRKLKKTVDSVTVLTVDCATSRFRSPKGLIAAGH